jgi:hypothetical protein
MTPGADSLAWMLEETGEPVAFGERSSFGFIRRVDLSDGEGVSRRVVGYRLTYGEELLPGIVGGSLVTARGRTYRVVGFDPAEAAPGLQVAFMEVATDA